MIKIEDNRTIYLDETGEIKAKVEYENINENTVNIYYTYVDPSLRGQKIASKLLEKTFNYLNKNNKKVICSCSYAKKWGINHEKFSNLVK